MTPPRRCEPLAFFWAVHRAHIVRAVASLVLALVLRWLAYQLGGVG